MIKIWLVWAGWTPVLAQTTGGTPPPPAETARAILSDPRFQTTLPQETMPSVPPWLAWLIQIISPFLPFLLYAGVGIALVWLLYFLAKYWGLIPRITQGGPSQPQVHRPVGDWTWEAPEHLAAQGRFGDAAHGLLLRVIDLLAHQQNKIPPQAATSRKLVHFFELRDARREAFQSLVGAVEGFLFGGRPVDRVLYDRCRESTRLFEQAP